MNNHNNQTTHISKFFSLVLRHKPEAIGLTLDAEGWADIAQLLQAAAKQGKHISRELLQEVVDTNDKKRFAISEDGLKIRAVQGHSTKAVDISYEPKEPPELLFHGTATRFLQSIKKQGLIHGSRQYVHLSDNEQTAVAVGQRHGLPVVLKVQARLMHEQGIAFYQADNGVWLTDAVPTQFLIF